MTQNAVMGQAPNLPSSSATPAAGTAPPAGMTSNVPSNQFTDAATAQGMASQYLTNQQTIANRANQINPFGSSTWTQDPTTGQWTQNVSLNGGQQGALNAQQQSQLQRSQGAADLTGQAVSNLQNPINTSGFASLYSFGTPGQTNQQAQDAVMGQLQPLLDQRRQQTETQLANQGITRGSAAWQQAEDQLARDENNARLQGVQAGFQQGNALNQQNINYGNYQQGQRQYQLGETQTLRNQPLSDVNSLLSGQQVSSPTFGQYGQAGVAQAPNYLGAAQSNYGSVLDQLNLSADQKASLNNGLFNLGGAFLNSSAGQGLLNSAGSYLSDLFGLGG